MKTTTELSTEKQERKIAGIVLCGGQSRRMGRPKADLMFGEETSLQRIVRVLGSVVSQVCVVGSVEQELPVLPDKVRFLRDSIPGEGPLAGLLTGLQALPEETETVVLCSCDVPLLQPEFVRLLLAHQADQKGRIVQARVVDDGDRLQPMPGLYATSLREIATALYQEGERSLQALLRACAVQRVTLEVVTRVDPQRDSLQNMNTEEDYRRLLGRFLSQRKPGDENSEAGK